VASHDLIGTSNSENGGPAVLTVPGKVVNLVSASDSLLRVFVSINNTKVLAIIDSGAVTSLMSAKLAKELNLTFYGEQSAFNVIGQSNLKSLGNVTCSVMIHDVHMNDNTFAVFPSLPNIKVQLLLGVDFLKNNQMELCIRQHSVIKHFDDGGKVVIHLDSEGKACNVMFIDISCVATSDVRF
jgi:hypothetical protein